MAEKINDTITLYNIEVPKEVINDKKPPKNAQKTTKKPTAAAQKKKTRTEAQKPVKKEVPKEAEAETKEALSQTSLDMLADLEKGLKKEEEEKAAKKKMEAAAKKNLDEIIGEDPIPVKNPPQKRKVAKKTTPTKKLATPEAKKASAEKKKKPPITEIKLPYMERNTKSKDWNDGARPVRKNKNLSKVLSWFIPTHGDEMTEILRKGLVIICIVVLIFSMGVLLKSTRLEKKASEKNAGTYFVNKYVTSYEIYNDKES